MSDRRVLFVVEGEKDDPRFLKKMHELLLGTKPDNIFSFGASIHQLFRKIFVDGRIDEDLDLTSVLMEDADEEEQEILKQDFSDIYLIFDMDPQDSLYDDERLLMAMRFFDDSTENGKLYLNYPMLESYRHLKSPYDPGYLDRTVSIEDIRTYKKLVNDESYPDIKDLGRYTDETFMMIIELNIRKANMMLSGSSDIPEPDEYYLWDLADVLAIQAVKLSEVGRIHVINTSVFNAVDYNPVKFLNASV